MGTAEFNFRTTDQDEPVHIQAPSLIHQPLAQECDGTNESLLATHGKTFHFATRFLPYALRADVITLYTFFRTLDDLVDEPGMAQGIAQRRDELNFWREWFRMGTQSQAPREPLGSQLAEVLRKHNLPIDIFIDFLDGMSADLEEREIHTFAEMYRYCYCVAGTVGIAMTYILGARSPAALLAAEQLGVAMQITNILRDIREDLLHNRIYLPQEELQSFHYSRTQLFGLIEADNKPDEAFCTFMRYQIKRAGNYYRHGLAGVWLLPQDCRLPILIAGRLYRRILNVIEDRGYDVFHSRASTSFPVKVQEAMIAFTLDRLWRYGDSQVLAQNGVLF